MSRGRRRGGERRRPEAGAVEQRIQNWVPRTSLGKMIQEGRITSIEEVFAEGQKIREPEIVDVLLPDLQEEVININLVQKQSDAGEKSRFKAVVAVGNRDGYIGRANRDSDYRTDRNTIPNRNALHRRRLQYRIPELRCDAYR